MEQKRIRSGYHPLGLINSYLLFSAPYALDLRQEKIIKEESGEGLERWKFHPWTIIHAGHLKGCQSVKARPQLNSHAFPACLYSLDRASLVGQGD